MDLSIIVPTYKSDRHQLDELLDSVDAQGFASMQAEILFVDDGSPDNTFEYLGQIAARLPYVRAIQVEHSGWPCRPRNEGIEQAQGDFVLFMDHDDILFPAALPQALEYGKANDADAVNIWEVRTHVPSWGWRTYAHSVPRVTDQTEIPLQPLTPHKLYRRGFLNQHGIRFHEPTDSRELAYEDVYFNGQVLDAGARVSIFSEKPCYHWRATGSNSSEYYDPQAEGYGSHRDDYWAQLDRLLRFITAEIHNPRHRIALLRNYYKSRVLEAVGSSILKVAEEERFYDIKRARAMATKFVGDEFDDELSPMHRTRSFLMHEEHLSAIVELAEFDRGLGFETEAVHAGWSDDNLIIRYHASLILNTGNGSIPIGLRAPDGEFIRPVPPEIEGTVPRSLRLLKPKEIDCETSLILRGRNSRIISRIDTVSNAEIDQTSGAVTISGTCTIPMGILIKGRATGDDIWDAVVRVQACGIQRFARLAYPHEGLAVAFSDSLILAHATKDKFLAISLDDRAGEQMPIPHALRTSGARKNRPAFEEVRVDLRGINVDRDLTVPIEVGCWSTLSAKRTKTAGRFTASARSSVAALVFEVPSRPGIYLTTFSTGTTLLGRASLVKVGSWPQRTARRIRFALK